jgi:cytochrome c55X
MWNVMSFEKIIFGLALILGNVLPAQVLAEPDASALTNMVLQDCGSCHGMTLKGGLGPALLPENLEALPVEAVAAIIRDGVGGTAMPPWKDLLSDEEVLWISRHLKSGTFVQGPGAAEN